jgi:hypothetical protein
MLVDEVERNVIDVILAGDDPAVRNIFPHIVLPGGLRRLAGNLSIAAILTPLRVGP